jgi:hypothetical protein
MLTTIKGYYDRGQIVLDETPPVKNKTEVMVTFLSNDVATTAKRKLGGLEGQVALPDDFNEPLDELKGYEAAIPVIKGNKKIDPQSLFGIWAHAPRSLDSIRKDGWEKS